MPERSAAPRELIRTSFRCKQILGRAGITTLPDTVAGLSILSEEGETLENTEQSWSRLRGLLEAVVIGILVEEPAKSPIRPPAELEIVYIECTEQMFQILRQQMLR